MTSEPLLTILTPCFNRVDFVAEAVECVRTQGMDGVEHIVIDGGSTDGTLDVLARYPELVVVSEPDDGLYDALNKGLRMARGRIVGHLNTDDIYLPGTFSTIVQAFDSNPAATMVCGGAEIAVRDGDSWRPVRSFDGPGHCDLDWELVMRGPILTNARFYRRGVFDLVGPFDARYRIIADRDFLLRCAHAGVVGVPVDRTLYQYREHEGSLTFDPANRHALTGFEEKIAIASDHLQRLAQDKVNRDRYQRWRRYERANAVLAALRNGRADRALRHAFAGFADSISWLGYLPYRLAHAMASAVYQRLKA